MAIAPEPVLAAADLGIGIARLDQTGSPFPLWLVNADMPPSAAAEEILSREERDRADRFYTDGLRSRYVIAHCALRLILGRCFGIPAAGQRFAAGLFGKPYLTGETRAQFSLSYSGDRVLIGAAWGLPVGVDIERVRPIKDSSELVPYLYTDGERERLAQCGPGSHSFDRMFLELWTRKEACVKAAGLGLGEVRLSGIESGACRGLTTVRVGPCQLRTDTTLIDYDYIAAWAAGNVPVSSLIRTYKVMDRPASEGLHE